MIPASAHPDRCAPAPGRKWVLLAGYWLVQGASGVLLWPLLVGEDIGGLVEVWTNSGYLILALAAVAMITALQAVLLLPVRAPGECAPGRPGLVGPLLGAFGAGFTGAYATMLAMVVAEALTPRSIYDSRWAMAGAGAAGLLVGGLVFAILRRRYRGGMPALVSLGIVTFAGAHLVWGAVLAALYAIDNTSPLPALVWVGASAVALVGSWVLGTVLLLRFCRRPDPETFLSRLAAALFVGTIFEVAAIIPLDVMVRRKTNCYCAEATLLSLTLCWGAGVLVLGPAVWLVPLGRRRRRWLMGHCEVCGYDMTSCPAVPRCPECGTGWRRAPGEPAYAARASAAASTEVN